MSIQSKWLEQRFIETFEQMVPDRASRQIMIHAVEVFSKKGFAGAKIKDIAASAGFSQGYVYMYFKSKEEIFNRIVEFASTGAGLAVRSAAGMDGTAWERIGWLTEAFLAQGSLVMQHWRLIQLQTATTESIPEEAKRIAKEKIREPFEHLIPLITQGQQDMDIVEGDPQELAIAYFSFVQGLGIARLQTTEQSPFPSTDLVLRFMKRDR